MKTSILFAAAAGTAIAAPASLSHCVTSNAALHASYSDCAASNLETLTDCLANLQAPVQESHIAACHLAASCPAALANDEASNLITRCKDMLSSGSGSNGGADLRRRFDAQPEPTLYPDLFARQASQSGNECLDVETVKTTSCTTKTENGKAESTCSDVEQKKSKCKSGKTCTMDSTGTDICMDLQDSLDVGGIIIAIGMASLIVIGIGALTFLCCKDRKEQKRLQAKAEATALARAATKKKRAAERAPLMREQQGSVGGGMDRLGGQPDPSALGGGGGDPFHDQNRS